jgi:hypothetical protein
MIPTEHCIERFRRPQKTAILPSVPSRFFRVPLEQIAYVRAIVEGYDGLALVHAPDPRRGEVEWLIGEGLDDEAETLARRLADEAGLIEIARPADWPS